MPIYKRGPNRYCIRIYQQGKPRDWIVNGTKKEAETFESRKRLELAAAAPTESRTAPGFSDFCLGRYRLHAEAHLAPATWRNRQYTLATLIEHFENKRIDRITASDVEKYQHARLKDVSAVKVNDEVKCFKAILNYAAKHGVPARVPAVSRLPERKTKGRVKVWTADEVQRLYAAVQDECPKLLGMTVVLMNTGLRKGELLALEWSSVDLERQYLKIYPSEEWRPKDNEPREVPIGAAALPWLDVTARMRLSDRWVFPARRKKVGGKWVAERYKVWPQNQFDRAVAKAKVGGSPHVCRHTYASHFLAKVPDLFLLAQVLGHSHGRVTSLYSHLLPDHLERARDAVNMAAPLMLMAGTPDGHDRDTEPVRKRRKTGQEG